MKVLLAVPTAGHIQTETFGSLYSLGQLTGIPLYITQQCSVEINRESIIDKAIEGEYDYVIMVDSDMVFMPKDIDNLLVKIDSDKKIGMVAAIATLKTGELDYNVNWLDKKNGGWLAQDKKIKKVHRYLKDGACVQADMVGTGVSVFRVSALKELNKPYCIHTYEDGEWGGEDTSLCMNLQDAGYKTFMHFGTPVGHIGTAVYIPEMK